MLPIQISQPCSRYLNNSATLLDWTAMYRHFCCFPHHRTCLPHAPSFVVRRTMLHRTSCNLLRLHCQIRLAFGPAHLRSHLQYRLPSKLLTIFWFPHFVFHLSISTQSRIPILHL